MFPILNSTIDHCQFLKNILESLELLLDVSPILYVRCLSIHIHAIAIRFFPSVIAVLLLVECCKFPIFQVRIGVNKVLFVRPVNSADSTTATRLHTRNVFHTTTLLLDYTTLVAVQILVPGRLVVC